MAVTRRPDDFSPDYIYSRRSARSTGEVAAEQMATAYCAGLPVPNRACFADCRRSTGLFRPSLECNRVAERRRLPAPPSVEGTNGAVDHRHKKTFQLKQSIAGSTRNR